MIDCSIGGHIIDMKSSLMQDTQLIHNIIYISKHDHLNLDSQKFNTIYYRELPLWNDLDTQTFQSLLIDIRNKSAEEIKVLHYLVTSIQKRNQYKNIIISIVHSIDEQRYINEYFALVHSICSPEQHIEDELLEHYKTVEQNSEIWGSLYKTQNNINILSNLNQPIYSYNSSSESISLDLEYPPASKNSNEIMSFAELINISASHHGILYININGINKDSQSVHTKALILGYIQGLIHTVTTARSQAYCFLLSSPAQFLEFITAQLSKYSEIYHIDIDLAYGILDLSQNKLQYQASKNIQFNIQALQQPAVNELGEHTCYLADNQPWTITNTSNSFVTEVNYNLNQCMHYTYDINYQESYDKQCQYFHNLITDNIPNPVHKGFVKDLFQLAYIHCEDLAHQSGMPFIRFKQWNNNFSLRLPSNAYPVSFHNGTVVEYSKLVNILSLYTKNLGFSPCGFEISGEFLDS